MCEGESFWIWAVGSSNVQGTTKEELIIAGMRTKNTCFSVECMSLGSRK